MLCAIAGVGIAQEKNSGSQAGDGKRREATIDIVEKTMLAALGLAFLTKEKIEELAKEFVEKARFS